MKILDGKVVSSHVFKKVAEEFSRAQVQGAPTPGLAVILVGNDPASQVYVGHKMKACQALGFASFEHRLPATVDFATVQKKIQSLNQDPKVHGILVQLPLPASLNEADVIAEILPTKDVDGLTAASAGALFQGRQKISPCTPAGVMEILRYYQISLQGLHAVVVGRSQIVGRPMAQLLMQANATVTVAHSHTKNLKEFTRSADLVVAALGKPQFLTEDYFQEDAVVIDVGIHRLENKKLCGDVLWSSTPKVKALTPVPGGVGPMTIAMLMKNTWELYKLAEGVS